MPETFKSCSIINTNQGTEGTRDVR